MNKMLAYAAMLSLTMEWGVVVTRRDMRHATRREAKPDFSAQIIGAVESAVRIMNMDAVGTQQAAAIMQVYLVRAAGTEFRGLVGGQSLN